MTGNGEGRSIARRFADWSVALGYEDLPEAVRRSALRCIVDTLGVTLAGGRSRLGRNVAGYARQNSPVGPCWAVGAGQGLAAPGAALVNGTCGHAYDFDDTSYTGIMHGSTVVLPAALAACQTAGADGRSLLTAFVAGAEADYRLALLCTTHHYFKGWWSSGTFGALGAVTAAARALALNADQTAQAIGLAMTQAGGLKAGFGTDGKPYLAGRSAAGGLEAAFLVQSGLNGPPAVFEDPRGFLALMNDGRSDPAALDALGRTWCLTDPGILFKRLPVCSAAHAAAEVLQTLLADHGVASEQVRTVDCRVPPVVAVSLVYDDPQSPREAQFSLPFVLGCLLCHGDLGLEHLSQACLDDPALRAAMARVTMTLEEGLAEHPAVAEGSPECALVRVTCKDGRVLEGFSALPKGMPGNPLSDEELSAKFLRCARFAGLDEGRAQGLVERLWHMEEQPSLARLMEAASPI